MAWIVPFIPYIVAGVGALAKGISGQKTAETNADLAKQQGTRAAAIGELNATRVRRNARLLVGKQVAATAGSGVDLSGSPTDMIASDAQQAELDALNARYEGLSAKQSYDTQADIYRSEGKQAIFGSLLTGGAIGGQAAIANTSQTPMPTIKPGGGGGGGMTLNAAR